MEAKDSTASKEATEELKQGSGKITVQPKKRKVCYAMEDQAQFSEKEFKVDQS